MGNKVIQEMWEYVKETDGYSETVEKLLCWLIQNQNSATTGEMGDYFYDEKIESALSRLEKAAAANDGPNDLRNGYFVSEEEYIEFLNFCEKAKWENNFWI